MTKFIIGVWVALVMLYAYSLYFVAPSYTTRHNVTAVQISCTEDSWCWNSLINGNHLGSVPVFQTGE